MRLFGGDFDRGSLIKCPRRIYGEGISVRYYLFVSGGSSTRRSAQSKTQGQSP